VALEDLPTGWEEYASSCPAPTLSSANGITTPTAGLVPLWVMFKGYVARAEFLVCRELPVSIIIGASFMDIHVLEISPNPRSVTFLNGERVPLAQVPRPDSQEPGPQMTTDIPPLPVFSRDRSEAKGLRITPPREKLIQDSEGGTAERTLEDRLTRYTEWAKRKLLELSIDETTERKRY